MRIGVLTGGGDCPGLNAVIRAVVSTCDTRYGSSVVGFQDGWNGLLENRRADLDIDRAVRRYAAPVGALYYHLTDVLPAAEQARPLIGPNTRLITFQNGVDSVERIGPIIGKDNTVCGVAAIASVIASPGVIKHTSQFAMIRFGHSDKHADPVLTAFADAGTAALE